MKAHATRPQPSCQHQASFRFEAAVARETILSLSRLPFRFQTPIPVHGRQIASEITDGVNDRLASDSRGCLRAHRSRRYGPEERRRRPHLVGPVQTSQGGLLTSDADSRRVEALLVVLAGYVQWLRGNRPQKPWLDVNGGCSNFGHDGSSDVVKFSPGRYTTIPNRRRQARIAGCTARPKMLTLSKPITWMEAWQYYRKELQNPRVNHFLPIVSSWHGHLVRQWGLDKVKAVTEDTFANVAAGRDPRTGTLLLDDVRPPTSIRHDNQVPWGIAHRAGWEATVSASISVSLSALVGRDLRIHDAHRASVQTCLDELERFTQARMGSNHQPETTGRWIAALFEHDSARPAPDGYAAPQLHTHVMVFNLTTITTGEARPLRTRELYRSQSYATAIYLSELAYRLRGCGYEIDRCGRGFEIRGYTREYLAACRPEGVLLRRRAVESLERLRSANRDASHAQRQDSD